MIGAKILKAQSLGINAIVCVGDKAEEGRSTNEILEEQLNSIKD